MKGNIRVFCRVRPILQSDIDVGLKKLCKDYMPTSAQSKQKLIELKKNKAYEPKVEDFIAYQSYKKIILNKRKFKFDRIFQHTEDTESVFQEVEEVVQSFLDGFNVCIFAYGQTGSGKTYTMTGAGGIVQRAIEMIFSVRSHVKMSCYEIHVETVRDLLDPSNIIEQLMTN